MEGLYKEELKLIKENPELRQIITEDVIVPHMKKYKRLMEQKQSIDESIKKLRLHAQSVLKDVREKKRVFRANKLKEK